MRRAETWHRRAGRKGRRCRSSTQIPCWRWMSTPASWRVPQFILAGFDIDEHYGILSTSIFRDTRTSPVSRWARRECYGVSIVRARTAHSGDGHGPAEHDDHRSREGIHRLKPEVIKRSDGRETVIHLPKTSGAKNSRQMYNPQTACVLHSHVINCSTCACTRGERGQMGGECCRINMFQPSFRAGGLASVGRFRGKTALDIGRPRSCSSPA